MVLRFGKKCFISIVYIFPILFSVLSCKIEKYERDFSRKLKIVTTTGIIGDAVKKIAGDKADVTSLMGPGVDPHLYKASHGDLEELTSADIIFYNGLHLEGKMGEVLKKLGQIKPVIAVAEDIDPKLLTRTSENSFDPHIWFDVNLWSKAVLKIGKSLEILDSVNKDTYTTNLIAYSLQLNLLNQEITEQILSIPEEQRVLITAHDAFGYFGKAYGIEVKGLQGISTLSEFGLHDVTSLVDFITKRKIKAVFVETSVSEKAIHAVVEGCRQRGHPIKIGGSLYSDALGKAGTEEGTYEGMIRSNVRKIVEGLSK